MVTLPEKDYWVEGRVLHHTEALFDDLAAHQYSREDGEAVLIGIGYWDLADAWTNWFDEVES